MKVTTSILAVFRRFRNDLVRHELLVKPQVLVLFLFADC